MARRSKPAAWPARLLLAVLGAMLPLVAAAEKPKVPLADLPINGEWEVVYADRHLGFVAGRGKIDEEGGSAQVTFVHPVTGQEFPLRSRSLSRTGTKITIEFEGKSPTGFRNDGLDYPQRHLIVPEETGKVIARVGANSANKAIAPRLESDLDRLTLELTLVDQDKLAGTWRYKADPFTGRDRNGFGRVGVFKVRDDGSALQSGPETWTRPQPEVLGAFTLNRQTGWHQILNEPFFPHPYQDDKFKGKKRYRTVVIFGTDLPDGRNNRAVIKSGMEAVSYGRVIYPDSTFQSVRGHLKPFEKGKAKLLKIFEEQKVPTATARAAVEAFDYLVVEATLSEGVEPGFQEFSVNGSDGTWTLRFGNNGAEIRFIRAIDPTAIPKRKVDTFEFIQTNPDKSISGRRLNIEVTDKSREESVAPANRTLVKPGEMVKGDLENADTFGLLPGTIERLRRRMFSRSGETNLTDKLEVLNPGTFVGRHGTLVLDTYGSFTYTAYPQVWTRDEFEQTNDAFIPETILVAVRTEIVLPRDKILVTIGKNGAVQKMAGEERFPAYRVAGDPQLYLTDPILLTGSRTAGNGGGREEQSATTAPPGQAQLSSSLPVFARLLKPPHPLTVAHGDKLSASIADPGLISLVPDPAKLTASISPARIPGGLSYLWKDHLKRAAACYPDLGEIDWNRSDYDFVATIEEDLNFEWWKVVSPITMLFTSETLETDFQLGDHAALLMMRQAFVQQLTSKIKEFTFISDAKEELQAFWLMLSPYRWNVRQHALTNLKFKIEVTGPNGTQVPFRETYWNEYQQEARTYDRPGDVPDRFLRATREALQKYIEILSETLATAKEVEDCEVKDLVKLTGRHFQNVETWLTPRMMRLGERSRRGWLPDYHGRLRIHQVADKLWQVRAHQKLSEADTQQALMVIGVLLLPVTIASAPAAVILGAIGLGFEAYTEVPKYLESQAELAFARGTSDILGYGRYEQAKADEYGGDKLAISLLVASAGLAADVAGVGGFGKIIKAHFRRSVKFLAWARRMGIRDSVWLIRGAVRQFGFGVRYLAAQRGKALLERLGFDFSKLSARVSARDFKGLVEYLAEAIRQRARRAWLGDSQFKALERLKARNNYWNKFVESSSADVKQAVKDSPPRGKFRDFMESAKEVVDDALMGGGRRHDEAMAMLRYSPQTTPERFRRALEARMKLRTEPLGEDLYKLASRGNHDAASLVRKGRWFIDFDEEGGTEYVVITIRSPDGSVDDILRSYDKGTGTFSMISAERANVPGHIDVGLAQAISPKGFPTFLFAQLRFLNWAGVGYGGKDGEVLKQVVMKSITNVRTNVQLTWFRETLSGHPDKSFQQLVDEGLLDDFLIHTRSVQYARSIINMAGYRIKRVSLVLTGEGYPIKEMEKYFKIGKDGETWEQFLKRYSIGEDDISPPDFDIKIEVEPHPDAFGNVAANDNLPRPPGGGSTGGGGAGGGSTSGGGDVPPGGRPPDGEPPSGGATGAAGDDEPGYMQTLRRLRQEMDESVRIARDRYLRGVEDGTELMPHTADEFEAIAQNDMLLEALESAVEGARRAGVPDDVIANHIANFEQFASHRGRLKQVNRLNTRALGLEGTPNLIPMEEAGDMSILLGRVRAGTTTPEDLAQLRELIQQAADEGRDFIDDLGGIHVLMPHDTSEPLANAYTLDRLRELAERENLYPTGTGPSADSAPDLPPDVPPGVSDQVDQRLANLDPGEREARRLSAELLVRMGVPDESAADFAAESTRSLIGSEGGSTISPLRQAIFLADGIMLHGSRRVDFDEFAGVTGLPSRIVEVAAQAAAMERGLAPLPEEILPGRLYPPVGF
ncbi:MAG: hypothetical protein ACE5FR_04325 [Rhodospirillales bacterium]